MKISSKRKKRIKNLIPGLLALSCPLYFLFIFGRESVYPMYFSFLLFWLGAIIMVIQQIFSKNNIIKEKPIRDEELDRWSIIADLLARLALILGLVIMLIRNLTPFLNDTYDLFFCKQVLSSESVVSKIETGSGRIGLLLQTVYLCDIDNEYDYYFSPGRIRKGHRYQFNILPRTGIILTSKESILIHNDKTIQPPPNQALKLTE